MSRPNSSEEEDLYTKFNNKKDQISVLDKAADTIFPTLDEEDLAFQELMDAHEREKQAIVTKETSYKMMNVQLSDGKIIKIRLDVLNLSPFLKNLLEGVDANSSEVLSLPDNVYPDAADKIFSFLEATLMPTAKRPALWVAPASDNLMEFLRRNKDLILALNFLHLLPHEYSYNKDIPRKLYSYKHFKQEDGTPYPQYLQDGFKYDPKVPPTADTIKFIIEEEALHAYPAIQHMYSYLRLSVKTLDDIREIISFPVEVLQEAFHIKEVVLDVPNLMAEKEFNTLVDGFWDLGYKFSIDFGNSQTLALEADFSNGSDILKYFHLLPAGPFKDRLKQELLEMNSISLYSYNLKSLNGLPDDILDHLKNVITISDFRDDVIYVLKEISDIKQKASYTQGEFILEEVYLKKLETLDNSKPISLTTIEGLELLRYIPDHLIQRFTFNHLERGLDKIKSKLDEERATILFKTVLARGIPVEMPKDLSNFYRYDVKKTALLFDIMNTPGANIINKELVAGWNTDLPAEALTAFTKVLSKMTKLETFTFKPTGVDDLKLILPSVPRSVEELNIVDYFYHVPEYRPSSFSWSTKKELPEYDEEGENKVYEMIKTLSEYPHPAKKTFSSIFQGKKENMGYVNETNYDLSKLLKRVDPFSDSVTIDLKQRGGRAVTSIY